MPFTPEKVWQALREANQNLAKMKISGAARKRIAT
jgi:hypothetical protein